MSNAIEHSSRPRSAASLSRVPFTDQLSRLTAIRLPDISEFDPTPLADRCLNGDSTEAHVSQVLAHISSSVDRVLFYFKTARAVLGGLDAEDDVEWIYEGRQAIFDIGAAIPNVGDLVAHLMTILESTKDESTKDGKASDNDSPETAKQYVPIIDKIEQAIRQWHEILELVRSLRAQVDMSTEWKDLYEQILTEVEAEIEDCSTLVFEVEEKHCLSPPADASEPIDIDVLNSLLEEASFAGPSKLPELSVSERDLNAQFLTVRARIQPLRTSLSCIPDRLEFYSKKAAGTFPSSVAALKLKYEELEDKFEQLARRAGNLEYDLGTGRWKDILKKTGDQATGLLETLHTNLQEINAQQLKARQGLESDTAKMDACATENGYLMPRIARYMAVIDRAVRENYVASSDIRILQASLHSKWNSLLVLAEKRVDLGSSSPSKAKRSHQLSVSAVSTTTEESMSSPNSTPSSSPSLLSPTEDSTHFDINPIRGLAIKFPGGAQQLKKNRRVVSDGSHMTRPDASRFDGKNMRVLSLPGTELAKKYQVVHHVNAHINVESLPELSKSSEPAPKADFVGPSKATTAKPQRNNSSRPSLGAPHVSQIPVMSPERRSSSRMSLGSPVARPVSRLSTVPSQMPLIDQQTPSKIPRPSSRAGSTVRASSRLSMAVPNRAGAATPTLSRLSGRLELPPPTSISRRMSVADGGHPGTPSHAPTRRVVSSSLARPARLSAIGAGPGSARRSNIGLRPDEPPTATSSTVSSAAKSRMVPPTPVKPRWR